MATGRVLVVHESGGTRALLKELLDAEGLAVETASSTIQCISRFVDEPAELVVLGLSALAMTELELIRTLKAEAEPPRIVVCFPSPKRDIAVQALAAGADAYVLEPFYPKELVAVVRGQRAARAEAETSADLLARFAGEVAHAINNPLQVILLLLAKERVTKKELMDHIPQNVERIHRAVGLLREYGKMPEPLLQAGDARAVAERAAADAEIETFEARAGLPAAMFDEHLYAAALQSLFDALRPESVRLEATEDALVLRAEGDAADLLDHVLVVTPEREIRPGLLLARTLLERQGGSLVVEGGDVVACIPLA